MSIDLRQGYLFKWCFKVRCDTKVLLEAILYTKLNCVIINWILFYPFHAYTSNETQMYWCWNICKHFSVAVAFFNLFYDNTVNILFFERWVICIFDQIDKFLTMIMRLCKGSGAFNLYIVMHTKILNLKLK